MRQLKWKPEPCGQSLWEGPNKRALIVPTTPRKWNGHARYIVDALGLDRFTYVRTLREARELAEKNA